MSQERRPTQKVTASAAGGAAGLVLAWLLGELGMDISGEVGAAFSTLGAFAFGYLRRDA